MKVAGFDVGRAVRCADGFVVGGDAAIVRNGDNCIVLGVIDVLGHGPQAHAAAAKAEQALVSADSSDAVTLLRILDAALAGTIGAAATVATVRSDNGLGCFVGVGNAVARMFGGHERRLVSVDGIVGNRHASPRPAEFVLDKGDVLVLYTDGVSSRFDRADYPQLPSEDVEVSARELIRRFGKTYDDAACIVARRLP